MKITGKYEKDSNFIRVYTENRIYDIARNTGDWGYIEVGSRTFGGQILTQEEYERLEAKCEKEGTFELRN